MVKELKSILTLLTSACSNTHVRSSDLTNGPPTMVIVVQLLLSTSQGNRGRRRFKAGTAFKFTEQSTPPKPSSHWHSPGMIESRLKAE